MGKVIQVDFINKEIKRKPTVKIGLLGGIRSGKDTVTNMIERKLEGDVEKYAFSEGIHEIIKEFTPDLYSKGKPREALQEIGQLMRKFDPDVWINRLLYRVRYSSFKPLDERNILITDVRQPNEAKRLQEEGYTILKVVADPEIRIERAKKAGDNFTVEMFEHETEKAVEQCSFDFFIDNSGTLEELEAQVNCLITAFRGCDN